jgi:hypothetical protein
MYLLNYYRMSLSYSSIPHTESYSSVLYAHFSSAVLYIMAFVCLFVCMHLNIILGFPALNPLKI